MNWFKGECVFVLSASPTQLPKGPGGFSGGFPTHGSRTGHVAWQHREPGKPSLALAVPTCTRVVPPELKVQQGWLKPPKAETELCQQQAGYRA